MRASGRNLNLIFEQEIPSGTPDDSLTTFTILQTPYSQKAVMLWQDGFMLVYGVHFTVNLATKTITMLTAPRKGQDLVAVYLRKV